MPPDAEFTIGPLTFQAKYEYKGDLSKLPATVLAEEPAGEAETTQAWGESPDFELIDEPPAKARRRKGRAGERIDRRPVRGSAERSRFGMSGSVPLLGLISVP